MFLFRATGIITLLFLLIPFLGFSQQNGSKKPAKTIDQKTKAQKPASSERKPAPPELQKMLQSVLKQNQEQEKEENSLGYEIDGLLIDETLTKFGHDFYDIFYSGWEAPPKVNNYTIRIKEKPAVGRGFLITVQVNEETVIEQNLQPNYGQIEEIANYSVAYITEYLMNYENLKNQIDEDDQKGTGMF